MENGLPVFHAFSSKHGNEGSGSLRKLAIGFGLILMITSLFFIGPLQPVNGAEPAWVTGDDASGINYDSDKQALKPVLAEYNNTLYAAWIEKNGLEATCVRVKKRQADGSWVSIDVDPTKGMNRGTNNAEHPSLVAFGGSLYLAWQELDSGIVRMYVSRYNGTTWTAADGGSVYWGSSTSNCKQPELGVFNGGLYLIWMEENVNNRIYVKYYDGSSWNAACTADSLNYDGTKNASNPTLGVYETGGVSRLYAAWEEVNASGKNIIRVKRFDGGTAWTGVDDGGHGYDPAYNSMRPSLAAYNGFLYLAWDEDSADYHLIRLKKYNGSWTDGGPDNYLNVSTDADSLCPNLLSYNNTLYLTWNENKEIDPSTYIHHIRVKKLNNSNWSYVNTDGTTDGETGINYNSTHNAKEPFLAQCNDELYVGWQEGPIGTEQIRVKKYLLPKATLASAPAALTEDNLDSSSISVTLAGTSIIAPLNQDNFSLLNAPSGLTIESVEAGADSSHCTVNLAFDGSDFDADISNLGLTILGSQLTCSEDLSAKNPLLITAVNDNESISINDDGDIIEGNEDGEEITVTLNGGTFAPALTQANWQVENQPDGVTWTISRVNHTTAKITLSGNATASYPADITNLTVTCNTNEYRDSTGGTALSANSGVIFKAYPRVVAPVSIVHKTYKFDEQIIIDVKFNKVVQVSGGVPYIPITIGTDNVQAQYISGDNTDTLRFSYTVVAGQLDIDGISIGPAIVLPGGASIKDSVGNNAVLTLNIGSTADIYVDGVLPTMTGAVRDSDTQITVSLSENCTPLTHSNDGGFSVTEIGSGAAYTVSATAPGDDASHIVLTVADMGKSGKEGVLVKYTAGGNGDIQDTAGNLMASDATGQAIAGWDTTAPAISSASDIAADNTYIDIQLSEGIYGADDGASPAAAEDFNLIFDQKTGTATGAAISSIKKTDDATEGLAGALTGGEETIRIFLDITGTPSGEETIEIKPQDGASLYDKAGNAMADSQSSGEKNLHDMTMPPVDTVPPTLVSAQRLDDTHITATLSEDCTNISKANDGGFSVTETGSGTAYAVTGIAPHGDNRHIKLDVENMSPSARAGVTLKYTAGGHGNVQDMAGNPMADNLSGILISPWDTDVPGSSVTITSAILAADNSYLDLSVSESVYGSVYAATPLTPASFSLIFNRHQGTAVNVKISSLKKNDHQTEALASVLNGGETIIRIFLRILGIPNGYESIEIKPSGVGIFDRNGQAVPTTLTSGIIMLHNRSGGNPPSGGSSSPGSSGSGTTNTPASTSFFKVDKDGSAGTVTFNETLIMQYLNTAADRPAISIPVNDQVSTVVTRINGIVATKMAEKNAVLKIMTGDIQYILPVTQLNPALVQQTANQDPKNLLFSITIAEPPQETIRIVEDAARQNHCQIVVPPVSFEIICSNEATSLTVSNFNTYVERMIALPEGFNPAQAITGVVVNSDGTFSHVPTAIVQENGRYYARIQSLTNSTYLIISRTGSFPDIKGHWAQAAIEDMCSRLIVKGMDKDHFMPDREITRAEFAALIVNAMGVAHRVNKTSAFSDINTTDWFYQPVNTIKEYGLIKGYEDNTYRPNQLISREEAMVIIMQVIKMAGVDTAMDDREASSLLSQYKDKNTISSWAEKACAVCSKYQIVAGNQGLLSPADKLNRAQAAIMVKNMLKQAKLI